MLKLKRKKDSRFTHQNKLNKPCFQHDMVYEGFMNFFKRGALGKVLRDKAFSILDVKEISLQ